ncbi:calcium channel protein, partial [Linderina macrospora]
MDSDQMRRFSWFYFTTMALGIFCSIEVMVKGVAHGFVLAPHASLKTPWNIIDLLVSVSLFVSLYTLVGGSNATRFVRFLRSLRSVRLISKFKDARDAFNNLLVSSAANIIVGMWIMLLLLIPCATLANNMWYSLLFACNDDTVDSRIGCIGEYFDSDLGILIPRVWANPHNYDFDTFINAFAILFTAISNEGWTDVMSDTMAIRGIDLQPSPNYAWWNSLWWVAYSMFATIFVLYIFIGIIVASYTQRTGTAFLTTEQRRWLDLKVQLRGTHSPTLPRTLQKKGFRRWCFMASIKTNTWYSRTLTIAALANCIVLLTVYRDRSTELDRTQKGVRYAAYIVFVLDFVVHIVGMGVRATLRNANYQLLILCALVIVLFEFIFTTLGATSFGSVMLLYKLTLISDSLNELTRMVIGGFRPILSLFWVWMVVTLIFTLLTVEL